MDERRGTLITPEQNSILKVVENLHLSDARTDHTFMVDNVPVKVHKAILEGRSNFFKEKFNWRVKEDDPNMVKFPADGDEPEHVRLVIQYMYEADYAPKLSAGPSVDVHKPNPLFDSFGSWYTYEALHTCDIPGSKCSKPTLFQHHHCESQRCDWRCQAYTCNDCQNLPAEPSDGVEHLSLHIAMWVIGDKYSVHGLGDLARYKLRRICLRNWNTGASRQVATAIMAKKEEDPKEELTSILVEVFAYHIASLMKEGWVKELLSEKDGYMYQRVIETMIKMGKIKPASAPRKFY